MLRPPTSPNTTGIIRSFLIHLDSSMILYFPKWLSSFTWCCKSSQTLDHLMIQYDHPGLLVVRLAASILLASTTPHPSQTSSLSSSCRVAARVGLHIVFDFTISASCCSSTAASWWYITVAASTSDCAGIVAAGMTYWWLKPLLSLLPFLKWSQAYTPWIYQRLVD